MAHDGYVWDERAGEPPYGAFTATATGSADEPVEVTILKTELARIVDERARQEAVIAASRAELTVAQAKIQVLTDLALTGRRDDLETILITRTELDNLTGDVAAGRASNLCLTLALSVIRSFCADVGQSNDLSADRVADVVEAICADALARSS